ncbi:hypothetical protein QC761_0081180 [Podospora bellae-mahoneyi]|uniref:DUF7600 domain-containing protein n=1 Tax=Podospora bellae-mahoneyi TaxID=2093777 RepID=A0ABR0FGA0_9PEZI|nr:hypothetical protein QC761_0081180 [Podospora bellae-mahoneyi]
MSPIIWACPICGWDIDGLTEEAAFWFNQAHFGSFIAPQNPAARYDDEGYDKSDDDMFSFDGHQPFENRRGFAFHNVCWTLLKEAFWPKPIPLGTTFQIFDSLTLVIRVKKLDSGYGYGVNSAEYFPWEINIESQEGDFRRNDQDTKNALHNRNHILQAVQKVADLIKANSQVAVGSSVPPWNVTPEPDDGRWSRVAGSMQTLEFLLYPLPTACRELLNHKIVVSDNILRVSVSTVEVGDFSYISGIVLTSPGHTITIGYMGSAEKQQHRYFGFNDLTGFRIAVGIGGIHAIQCTGTHVIDWWLAGLSRQRPHNKALDGFRLISIGTSKSVVTTVTRVLSA